MAARLKDIQHDQDAADEHTVLHAYAVLIEQEAAASRCVKAAQYAKLRELVARHWLLTTNGWQG
ncbi:MAG: hypothetical protein ACYDHM_13910 [Acidiferrobacterales bacterium]